MLAEGWRVPFILGGVFGLVAVWLRQYLHETPVFKEMQARQQLSNELPLKTVVREHRPAVVLTMLLTWLLSAAIVVMILMTPILMQKLYAIPAVTALQANSIATLFLSIGCVASGRWRIASAQGVCWQSVAWRWAQRRGCFTSNWLWRRKISMAVRL